MQKVLVAPLQWGLGHATRCIVVIQALKKSGADVVICASGKQEHLLKHYFPNLSFIDIPGYDIRYSSRGNMGFSMAVQAPDLLKKINNEHRALDAAIDKYSITHVISDNRFGLWSEKIKSVFITHQVHIDAPPVLKQLIFLMNRRFIEKYDRLWIPDFSGTLKLAGHLSAPEGIRIPYTFTGPLSRFKTASEKPKKVYDVIAMISGPEPQRTLFEELLVNSYAEAEKKLLIIRGLPGETALPPLKNRITWMNHISDEEFTSILHPETLLITRPGYSTLMDLHTLGHAKAYFVPTPGQTEQEYLAAFWKNHYQFEFVKQTSFTWEKAFNATNGNIPGNNFGKVPDISDAINEFLS